MKIAIQPSANSFSDLWMSYCKAQQIPFKLVNCYDSDIIQQVSDCDIVLWHFNHQNAKDRLCAKSILSSIRAAGKLTFPDEASSWHFDDKVAQKYLLESIGAPLVPSYVFYDQASALDWCNTTSFPKVFKLKGGAGASNVQLVKNVGAAAQLIQQAFGKGFSQYNSWSGLKERIRKYRNGKTSLKDVAKGIGRLFIKNEFERMAGREKGYAYFQDFIPNNSYDIRVIVIGNKAFAIKRNVRENDFRASGSGSIEYDKSFFDEGSIQLAFSISQKLNAGCLAYDFVYHNNEPLIVEISFGFAVVGYGPCPGYWTNDMQWHEGAFIPQHWMIEDLMHTIKNA
ncbi:MAG: ATP-grasp domain-containing protein [Ferruginibacter sp.]